MAVRKGLSEVIGFLILLVILLVVLIPLSIVLFSQPTVQQQQMQNAQPYKNLAVQQFRDFEPIQLNAAGISTAPVYFIYVNSSNAVYFVFLTNTSPPVPLVIKYLMIYNGTTWVRQDVGNLVISPANANAKYYGYPAIKVPLSVTPYNNQPSYVAAVTQYGNIIYASPPYVIPLPKAKGPAGIITIDPYNFTVVQNPTFHSYSLSKPEPLMWFMGNLSVVSPPTLAFYTGYLRSSNNYPFTYDGSWFGPIIVYSGSPWFYGTANGTFIYANFSFTGTFNGIIGHAQQHLTSYPVWLNGNAQYAIFNETALVGSLRGIFDNVNITIPGKLLNNLLLVNPKNLYITITSNAIGTYTYYLININGTVTYTGEFTGTINGTQVTEGSGTISGLINGTIKGVITSATLYAGYYKTLLGYVYLNGYIAIVGQVPMTVTFSGAQVAGKYVAIPIINGEVLSPSFNNAQAYPAPATTLLPPFNITLNNFEGSLSLSNQYAQGVFKGNITFPKPTLLSSSLEPAIFDGYLDGIFSGTYELGEIGHPVILSVISSNATIYSGLVSVLTPLIIRVDLAIYNPTNTTLEIDKVQVSMKADATIITSGGPYLATLFGTSEEVLLKPIIVEPLSNYSTALYLTIPVTNILAPGISTNPIQNLESVQVEYIELYVTFLEPSGYGIAVSALISPYTIPVYGSS